MGPFLLMKFHLPGGIPYPYPNRLYYLPSVFFIIFLIFLLEKATGIFHRKPGPVKPAVVFVSLFLAGLILFNGWQTLKRSGDWERAGRISKNILEQTRLLVSRDPGIQKLVFANLPDNYREAYIFRNGIGAAARLYLDRPDIEVIPATLRSVRAVFSDHIPDDTAVLIYNRQRETLFRVKPE